MMVLKVCFIILTLPIFPCTSKSYNGAEEDEEILNFLETEAKLKIWLTKATKFINDEPRQIDTEHAMVLRNFQETTREKINQKVQEIVPQKTMKWPEVPMEVICENLDKRNVSF